MIPDPDFDDLDELDELKRLKKLENFDDSDDEVGGFEKNPQGDNTKKNEEVLSLYTKYKLNKDQQRIIHDRITGKGLNRNQIEKVIKEYLDEK